MKELHSFVETENHFHVSQTTLQRLFKYFSIKKTPEQIKLTNLRNKPTIDKFANTEKLKLDYLSGQYRQRELADKYGITLIQLRNFIYRNRLNDIKRDSYFSRYTFEEMIDIIDNSTDKANILFNLHTKNMEKYANELNTSYKTLKKLLSYYNIENISKKLGYEKSLATKRERYGSVNNIEKIRKTNLEKYGCEYVGQVEEFKNKLKQTKLDRYGSETYNNREKFKDTMTKRYGDKLSSIVEKTQKTNIERYGEKYYSMTKEFREKQGKNLLTLSINNSDCSDEYKELYTSKEKSVEFLSRHIHEFTAFDLARRFECSRASIYIWTSRYGLSQYLKNECSHYEKDIIDWLFSIGITNIRTHCRNVLSHLKELDIYLPDYRLGIEFNGTFWHSTLNITDRNYHLNKSKECEALGIHLVHIYEYE